MVARDLVMITIGTGVGGGMVLGGRIYRGATGGAGELGHTLIGLDLSRAGRRPPGEFPQPGSLECDGRRARARRAGRQRPPPQHPESALGRMRAAGAAR